MAILNGCEEGKRTPISKEIPCPQCGEIMEVFTRESKAIEDVVCDKCGYTIPEGKTV